MASARTTAKVTALAVQIRAATPPARADQDLAAADKALADARTSHQAVTTALTAAKQDHAQASAAKAGADKALAEKKTAVDTAVAKVQALKTELDALAVEKKRFDATDGDGLAAAGCRVVNERFRDG